MDRDDFNEFDFIFLDFIENKMIMNVVIIIIELNWLPLVIVVIVLQYFFFLFLVSLLIDDD